MAGTEGTVLVVDDEQLNRMLLSTNLEEAGYTVEQAESGMQALDLLHENDYDVVLLDLLMPGIDGYRVLERMKDDTALRHVPVIVVSAAEEMEGILRCIELGAMDYLPKPFDPALLHARLRASMATKRLHEQQERFREEIEEHNRTLESRVREQVQEIQESYERLGKVLDGTVFALSSLVERRDPYTAGHQRRVSRLACAMAHEMGLPEEQIEGIRVAGILHDIGKVCVPAEILSKPGKISDAEFAVIAQHPTVGYECLQSVDFPWPIADIVHQHHEKQNGKGYPNGIAGDAILPEASILSVADVVEAVAYHRPYRAALGPDIAMKEIAKGERTDFNGSAVEACLTLFQERDFSLEAAS